MGTLPDGTEVLVILKDHGVDVDLSEIFTNLEIDDAIPQNMKLTLPASFGNFLTREPKIQRYDRIFVRITDIRGNVDIDEVFHVRRFKRQRIALKGKQLILFCPHQSENLWKRTISQVNKRISGDQALRNVIGVLNDTQNKGSNDPTVFIPSTFDITTKTGIFLDQDTSNDYIFEKFKLQQSFDYISDQESQPVEGGGSFEPTYIRFTSRYDHDLDINLDEVIIQAYPQGFNKNIASDSFTNIPNITLKHDTQLNFTQTNTLENDSDEDPELATNIHLVCDQNAGSFKTNWSRFLGARDFFNATRFFAIGQNYREGNLVNKDGTIFECIQDNLSSAANEPPNASFWIVRTFTQPDDFALATNYTKNDLVVSNEIAYKALVLHTSSSSNAPPNTDFWVRVSFVPTVDYSPLTKQKAQYWINALGAAKQAATNDGRTAMIDPNIVVPDALHPRTFVNFVASNPDDVPDSELLDGHFPDGYRILVITPTLLPVGGSGVIEGFGDFAGDDLNGVTFAGNVTEFVDPNNDGTGDFIVFKGNAMDQDQEVYDFNEGLPWVKFACKGVGSFVDGDGVCNIGSRTTDWQIGSYGIFELPLGAGQFASFSDGRQFECAHSVKFNTGSNRIDLGNKKIAADDVDGNSAVFIKSAASSGTSVSQNPFYVGFNFWSLFPKNSNAIPFGAVTTGEQIALPTMDLYNLFRTSDGIIDWFGPKQEEYHPIQAMAMWFQFIDTFVGSDSITTEGDYEMGIFLIDRRDNTRIMKFTQGKNNDTVSQETKVPGEFYVGVPGASAILNATEPEPTDAFDPRQVLFGGIYTRDSFDSQGRYKSGSPAALLFQIVGGQVNRFALSTELEMAVDGFRYVKPLVVTNVDDPDSKPSRNIETVMQRAISVISYAQAKNLVLGLARIFNHQKQRFKISSVGRGDVKQGDPVYYTDPEEIDDTTDSLSNTLKFVVEKRVITVSKGQDGPGGYLTDFYLSTRVWPTD